ncbi:hypothetical protein ACFWII_37355 [Streptomyces sp. NPDC127063]|uniref:hypothetical protein n=1 Tax=Streptomyces sp. NPDC127063 TaxID=3347123 RepID=UPI00365B8C52
MPDDLYDRYQRAARAHSAHRAECTHCTDTAHCPDGARLYGAFERLQDAYLSVLRRRSGR